MLTVLKKTSPDSGLSVSRMALMRIIHNPDSSEQLLLKTSCRDTVIFLGFFPKQHCCAVFTMQKRSVKARVLSKQPLAFHQCLHTCHCQDPAKAPFCAALLLCCNTDHKRPPQLYRFTEAHVCACSTTTGPPLPLADGGRLRCTTNNAQPQHQQSVCMQA